jgi:hypothetical protein
MTSGARSPWEQMLAAGLWREGEALRLHLGCASVMLEAVRVGDY